MSCVHSPTPDPASAALLGILLDAQPAHLSIDELVRLLAENGKSAAGQDDALVAVGDLVSHGLAHRHGVYVFATRAAVRFNELDGPSIVRTRSPS